LPLAPLPDMRRQSQEEIDEAKAEAEKNPAKLNLNADNIVMALEKYHTDRLDNAAQLLLMGIPTKKKTNFESEEQKADSNKKSQKMFW